MLNDTFSVIFKHRVATLVEFYNCNQSGILVSLGILDIDMILYDFDERKEVLLRSRKNK